MSASLIARCAEPSEPAVGAASGAATELDQALPPELLALSVARPLPALFCPPVAPGDVVHRCDHMPVVLPCAAGDERKEKHSKAEMKRS